jgi:sulfofructose kinase
VIKPATARQTSAEREPSPEGRPQLTSGRARVGFVGLSCRDHVWQVERFPPTESRTHATAYRAHGGGPAATAAVTAARLGAEAYLWAVHGDDDDGEACHAELAAEGIDVSGVRTTLGSRSFVSAVLVTPSGERFIFPYRGDALIDDPDGIDWSAVGRLDALLTDARHPAMARHALHHARASGVPTVGDWGDPRHWHLVDLVDHLIVSEECARLRFGRDDPVAALAALRATSSQVVGVTLGSRGVVWDAGEGPWRLSAPIVDAVDTTGAGDAFHGAYAWAIAVGRPPPAAMRLASAVAALMCRGHGRATLPDLAEAERLAAALPAARRA